jgi:hypothetical protein
MNEHDPFRRSGHPGAYFLTLTAETKRHVLVDETCDSRSAITSLFAVAVSVARVSGIDLGSLLRELQHVMNTALESESRG